MLDPTNDNAYVSIGVTNGLRDVLYSDKINPINTTRMLGLVAYGPKTRAAPNFSNGIVLT
jgi:hypothetical protein